MYRNQPGIFEHAPLKATPSSITPEGYPKQNAGTATTWLLIGGVLILIGISVYLIYQYNLPGYKVTESEGV